ncbi:uncharacterized protein LOC109788646 [Cajanus cajan]|uniref:uncharacterized protein LOC109788646 n=1 Tax=Cajanus cajan TaxID=3821 RepID=UPI00098D7837|nr:uncharacterized protein LOC109788646 [Cajanus cajan]
MSKKNCTVTKYLLSIKNTVDSLAAVGSPISGDEHIEAILDGLPKEFDSFITSITSLLDPYLVDDIEALLLAQEERFDKHQKIEHNFVQANTATVNSQMGNFGRGRGEQKYVCGANYGRGGRNNNRGGFNNYRRGRNTSGRGFDRNSWFQSNQNNWNNPKPQCQICGNFGHVAIDCWQRFNQDFYQPPRANTSLFHSSALVYSYQGNIAIPSTVQDPLWYLDSGTSHHMTNDEANLSAKSSYQGSDNVKIGNGAGLPIYALPTRTSLEGSEKNYESLLSELMVPKSLPRIYCDNLSAVLITANPVLHSKTKHFELDLHFVRDKVKKNEVRVIHLHAEYQVADTLTKPLAKQQFQHFRNKLMVATLDTMSLRGDVKGKG